MIITFQYYALYSQINVADNMDFTLTIAGGGKSEIRTGVVEVVTILDHKEPPTCGP